MCALAFLLTCFVFLQVAFYLFLGEMGDSSQLGGFAFGENETLLIEGNRDLPSLVLLRSRALDSLLNVNSYQNVGTVLDMQYFELHANERVNDMTADHSSDCLAGHVVIWWREYVQGGERFVVVISQLHCGHYDGLPYDISSPEALTRDIDRAFAVMDEEDWLVIL
jgi:hypothetical protein